VELLGGNEAALAQRPVLWLLLLARGGEWAAADALHVAMVCSAVA
jgi:hypothetical protein